jgi:hypothetical protein
MFRSVKMAYETPPVYHASHCKSMMCTLFLKIEYTLSSTLICNTNLTNCKTFLCNNNYVGDFQIRVIGHYNPFVETLLLVMKVLTVIS